MIPHRLNLLSPQKRRTLKKMVNFQFTKSLLELMLFVLSCTGIALLGGQWTLQNYFNEVTGHIVSITNKYAQQNLEIKDINLDLIKAEKIQEEYTLWTPKILELTNQIPDNIILSNLSFNLDSLNIIGTAQTRNDLLNLANNLKNIEWLDDIQIPPEQLTQKDNIQFSISPKIK